MRVRPWAGEVRSHVVRTRVKICGVSSPAIAKAAALAGADAVGLLFWAPSRRAVTPSQAARVASALPPLVSRVGVFVDPPAALVEEVLGAVRLDLLQFHGEESAAECRRYGVPYIKALAVKAGMDVAARAASFPDAQGLLLDAFNPATPGGSGEIFDWDLIPRGLALPVILAGGLHVGNVADGIRRVRPFAVDVSGGVEVSRGVKDAGKIAAFLNEVNSVEPA